MELTSTHEDYIELVYRMQKKTDAGVRVTDLASELGCQLPTVTRTVKHLNEVGYFDHEKRGLVRLSKTGQILAQEIAHRHDDVVTFLQVVLGLDRDQAERDACQLEHGFSPLAAERLHTFLEHLEALPADQKEDICYKASIRPFGNFDTSP